MLTSMHVQWRTLLHDQEKEAQPKRDDTGRKLINIGSDGEKYAFNVFYIVGFRMKTSVLG